MNEIQQAGRKSYVWDGKDCSGRVVSSGVYLFSINTEYGFKSKKMVLIK